MRRIATIGVYGFAAAPFLEKLTGAGVGLLLDLRQRRGVRGPDYSWEPDPKPPLISTEALLLLLITGWSSGAAIAWPGIGGGIAVGVAVLAMLIVATRA